MPRRLLNIASIVCLVACVALIALNVRSYYWADGITFLSTSGRTSIGSMLGLVVYEGNRIPTDIQSWTAVHRHVHSDEAAELPKGFLGFRILAGRSGFSSVPYWFLLLVTGLMSVVFRRMPALRFTLSSLFIAITLLAVLLGMIAWLDRARIGM
jgi:hypothetical protein